MQINHSVVQLAGHSLQRIDFAPETFQPEDLLWLPHHAQLTGCVRKRQTEHLAGRIAAVYALREVGEKCVPAIGDRRQPLWPAPWYGSISHCEHSALAVVSAQPIGVDIERIFSPSLAAELESGIIDTTEKKVLAASGLSPELALTLAFSAKESGFKAWSSHALSFPGFHSARVTAASPATIHLQLNTHFSPSLNNLTIKINWLKTIHHIVTCTSSLCKS